jgi:hypothetical protein
MGLAALDVGEMISGFPNPVLSIITAEPTLEDIMNTQKLLNVNCISILSLVGGCRRGHLELIMTVQEHAAILINPLGRAVDPRQIAQIPVGRDNCLQNKHGHNSRSTLAIPTASTALSPK